MILGQLRMGARQAKNAPLILTDLDKSWVVQKRQNYLAKYNGSKENWEETSQPHC